MPLLSENDLLAGAEQTIELQIPPELLTAENTVAAQGGGSVIIRPLSLGRFQLIAKAARDDQSLIPVLVIMQSVTQPSLGIEQIRKMPLGLVQFLIREIRQISGLGE